MSEGGREEVREVEVREGGREGGKEVRKKETRGETKLVVFFSPFCECMTVYEHSFVHIFQHTTRTY